MLPWHLCTIQNNTATGKIQFTSFLCQYIVNLIKRCPKINTKKYVAHMKAEIKYKTLHCVFQQICRNFLICWTCWIFQHFYISFFVYFYQFCFFHSESFNKSKISSEIIILRIENITWNVIWLISRFRCLILEPK